MIFNIYSAMKHSYSNDDTCFSIDVIDEILEEDFDVLLDEGSKILHSIEGTLLEEEIFAEFDEFMAMTGDKNSESESDTEEPPFEKITINTDYKIKTSHEEPLTDLKLKPLLDNLEYVFLEEPSFLPEAFAWKMTDILGICPSFCKPKIQLLDDKKLVVQKQKRLKPNMQEVVKKEIVKLLDTCIIYPIADSPWVSPIHGVAKKRGNRGERLCSIEEVNEDVVDEAVVEKLMKVTSPRVSPDRSKKHVLKLTLHLLFELRVPSLTWIPPDICHSPNTVLMNSSSKNNVGGVTHISCTKCQKADVTPIVDCDSYIAFKSKADMDRV
uniref:Reverse transcriptase domain-containing protein n=1 Tax=Tanacetum cinerariifolium TaxID=118510 RepID=A0A6L2P1I5_TANCI|nr:reverse transcriptase domain-containing protein [Tanacetum cinerariifolium]